LNIENELKLVGLTTDEYESFLEDCSDKVNGLIDDDWQDIIDKYHLPYNYRRVSESMSRSILGSSFVREYCREKYCNNADINMEALVNKEQDIYKAKRKLQDERTELNRLLREEARYEENLQLLETRIQDIGKERYPFLDDDGFVSKNNTIIVNLSDLHIGVLDVEDIKRRLSNYILEIGTIAVRHNSSRCIVNLLGDLISGNIHVSVQISNRENTVDQVILACELISDFIYELRQIFNLVEVYSVPGNHSRLEKNKDDSLLGEKLDNIIPWFISKIHSHDKGVYVGFEKMTDTYSSFIIDGKEYINVHGDFDGISESSVQKLCAYIGRFPYAIIMGHKHHIAMNEVSGIKVIQCGSLNGSCDEFCVKNRLTSDPSQTVLVCNQKGIEAIYPVVLG